MANVPLEIASNVSWTIESSLVAPGGRRGGCGVGKPFLKWAGGKRWVAGHLARIVDELAPVTYCEPFLGSGAVFFAAVPHNAMLSDTNAELVNAFSIVRDKPEELIRSLAGLAISKARFLAVREWHPRDRVSRAARMIYLNKTSFNGLYRVNKRGQFNVPFGCKPGTVLCEADVVSACSEALQGVSLRTCTYTAALKALGCGAVAFLDPPYASSEQSAFLRYGARTFSWPDQRRLATAATALAKRGVHVIMSNVLDAGLVSLLGRRDFAFFAVSRASRMSADPKHRGPVAEMICFSASVADSLGHGGIEKRLKDVGADPL